MAKIYGVDDREVTKNFSLSEFLKSRTADANKIQNKPSPAQIEAIEWVAKNVAQPIRDKAGAPMFIKSGFRNEQVNRLVGGVEDSYHTYEDGRWAFDFVIPSISLDKTMELLEGLSLPITKVILELDQGVIHVQGQKPEFLVRDVITGKKKYVFFKDYKLTGKVG